MGGWTLTGRAIAVMVYRADPAQAYRVSGRAERAHFLFVFFFSSDLQQTNISLIISSK
jgi:hypothetical protein